MACWGAPLRGLFPVALFQVLLLLCGVSSQVHGAVTDGLSGEF